MADSNIGTWSQYQKLVLKNLEDLERDNHEIKEKLDDALRQLAMVKVRMTIVSGAISTVVVVFGPYILELLKS